jgi:hypothetical protein
MTADEYRHDLTSEQKRMTDAELAKTLPSGTGVSLLRYRPFWDVVLISENGRPSYIVTDSSRSGQKPLKVHGPIRSRSDAVSWARVTAEIWRSTHVLSGPEWPWE